MLSTRQVLLHRVTQERGTVFHSIAFMPDEELERRPVIGDWSAKDVLGHLAAWEEEITRAIEQFVRGEHVAMLDIASDDGWNAVEAAKRWDMPLAQVKEELIAARGRVLALVNKLPDDAFTRPGPPPSQKAFVAQMLNALADHDREHWAKLMAYKQQWIAGQRAKVG